MCSSEFGAAVRVEPRLGRLIELVSCGSDLRVGRRSSGAWGIPTERYLCSNSSESAMGATLFPDRRDGPSRCRGQRTQCAFGHSLPKRASRAVARSMATR